MGGLCLSVALKLLEYNLEVVGVDMLNEGILKNMKLNIVLLSASLEVLVDLRSRFLEC